MMEHGRDASQKAELRERIIMTATEAFTLKGIKCITMDDIAAALGISKRTLYEVFADKESLLKECILQKQAERDKYWFPLRNPPLTFPFFCEGAPPSTHPLPPHYPTIPLHWGIEPSQDQGPLLHWTLFGWETINDCFYFYRGYGNV